MNNEYNITKGLSSELKAKLADGREICGHFFLAGHAENHYGEEILLDLLNQRDKPFVPFKEQDEEAVVLIRKAQIVFLRPDQPDSTQWPYINNSTPDCWPSAKVIFPDFFIEGQIYTGDMQPQRRRLTDLLNHPNDFFVIKTNEGPWIINKNLMNQLEPQT